MKDEHLAEIMYRDYCEALGDDPSEKTAWDDLEDDDRARWVYVAEMVREPVINDANSHLMDEINELEDRLDSYRTTLWKVVDVVAPILNLSFLDRVE